MVQQKKTDVEQEQHQQAGPHPSAAPHHHAVLLACSEGSEDSSGTMLECSMPASDQPPGLLWDLLAASGQAGGSCALPFLMPAPAAVRLCCACGALGLAGLLPLLLPL